MMNWQLLSFETDLDPQTPSVHPQIILAAIEFANGSSADFCILMRFRIDGDKVFRDYYFSPTAIILCGPVLARGHGILCEKPSGSGLDLVAGACASSLNKIHTISEVKFNGKAS